MAKRAIERTDFHNPGSNTVEFILGTTPNDLPEKIVVLPGETIKGFANYEKFYKRNGLIKGTAPGVSEMREEAAQAREDAAQAREDATQIREEANKMKAEAEKAKADAGLAMAEARAAKADAALILEPVTAAQVEAKRPATKPASKKKSK